RRIVGIEDERFGVNGAGLSAGEAGSTVGDAHGARIGDRDIELGGPGALLAALEGARTGFMRDIVGTIQREQDEIIRSALPGVLVVQGGPGTGKTAVALHRAAYLLYTHRFPLERQGVLVIGPNPLFLRYIEHVLPSLGESGVTLTTISGLVHGTQVRGEDAPDVARLKGEARMAPLVARAVRSRQRALRRDVEIPFGATILRLTAATTATVVSAARRRPGTHNARRRFVEQLTVRHLADEYTRTLGVHGVVPGETARPPGRSSGQPDGAGPAPATGPVGGNGNRAAAEEEPGLDIAEFSRQVRRSPQLAEALDRMWPRLSAEELLHDLYGSPPLLALAGKGVLTLSEQASLRRARAGSPAEIPWTVADLALIDEARVLLGPRRPRGANGAEHQDGPRTYGHIVVDEAQDLSPMQLRSVGRRSLSGSITVVGDIGQATGPWAPASWEEVTAHLPSQRPARKVELTVSYRTPAEVMEVAGRVLAESVPGMVPPRAVRRTGSAPRFVRAEAGGLAEAVAAAAAEAVREVAPGTAAVLAPASLVADLAVALDRAGVAATDPRQDGLGAPLSLLPVDMANGLEFDAVIVVEPPSIVEESPQGLRALYVALTRPTRRLVVAHARELPRSLHA
ncbi:MAG TPA: hypothetical protein VKU86_04145, partial [Acidimicrobiales bacterium]|nr:hypothetical protein [Acidimicrobiales bacterium]